MHINTQEFVVLVRRTQETINNILYILTLNHQSTVHTKIYIEKETKEYVISEHCCNFHFS